MHTAAPANARRVPQIVRRSRSWAEAEASGAKEGYSTEETVSTARCSTESGKEQESAVSAAKQADLREPESTGPAVSAISRRANTKLTRVVLRFTTLSNDAKRGSFVIDERGGSFGRDESSNAIAVPSDLTMEESNHAEISWDDGTFRLCDKHHPRKTGHVAVRVSNGTSRDWPLAMGAAFSVGNSVFVVTEVDGAAATLTFEVKSGPLKGQTRCISRDGASFGRASENSIAIADRELSRRHSQIVHDASTQGFYLCDLHSTNGTYMQLCGPYEGPYCLAISDQILVARTGFSVNRFDFGVSEECGMRRTMEDKSIVVQDFGISALTAAGLGPQSYVAVYDGHGGAQASQYLSERLHQNVMQALSRAADEVAAACGAEPRGASSEPVQRLLHAAIKGAFLCTDEQFIATSEYPQAGSTATTVMICGRHVFAANVGDSRTVLCTRGVARALSVDHKPGREDEATRIKAAGGFIIHGRVMGELAVSRAFGDAEFKKGISEILGDETESWIGGTESSDLSRPLVVAEPEITTIELPPEAETACAGDFLLLACDGLFDVFNDQAAIDMVRSELDSHGDPQVAAEALTHAAIHERCSRDNVSVVIVLL